MKLSRPQEYQRLAGRPLQSESKMNINDEPNRTGGLMGFVMPIYTIGIVVFFLYTILRMTFSKDSVEPKELPEIPVEERPVLQPDFQMNPEYRKFIYNEEYDENGERMRNIEEIKRKAKFINKNLNGGKHRKNKQLFISKALHVLIRDMEEFKSKIKVEETNERQTKPNDSTEEDIDLSDNNSEKEINEKSDKLDEECSEKTEENENNITNESYEECDEQNENESDIENEVNEKFDETFSIDNKCRKEDDIKRNILKNLNSDNLNSDVWESLLKGMKELETLKEE
ncbi:unnamed protein product, partial [Medioppia subpectinata]